MFLRASIVSDFLAPYISVVSVGFVHCLGIALIAALPGGVGDCVIDEAGRDMFCLWRAGGRGAAVGGFQSPDGFNWQYISVLIICKAGLLFNF